MSNVADNSINKDIVVLHRVFMLLLLAFLAGCTVEQRLANKLSCDGFADPWDWYDYNTEPFDPDLFFCEQGVPHGETPVMICYAYRKDKVAIVEYLYEGETPIITTSKNKIKKFYSLSRVSVGRLAGGDVEPTDLVEVIACE